MISPLTQLCLALAALLLCCALFLIYLTIRQLTNHMKLLAKAVGGTTEVISTLKSRIYLLHGVYGKLKFRCSFTPPVKASPPEFAISFYGNFPGGLSIRKRQKSDSETAKAVTVENIQTGDENFDRLFITRARQGHSSHNYLEEPSRRTLVMKFLNREDSSLFFEGASARVIFKGLELMKIEPHALKEYLDLMTGLAV